MKTQSRFVLMFMLIVSMTMAACNKGQNDNDKSIFLLFLIGNSGGDAVVSIAEIPGVTPPNFDEIPVTAITETAQYTGTVSWWPDDNPFATITEYMAIITLTAKPGYTLTGVAADFFTVAGATSVANSADSGVVTAVFPATGAVSTTVINIAAIPGVTAPAYGATPVTAITETDQYTGTVAWSPNHNPFAATTAYTATITLTAKPGYTLTGVAADFFTVADSTSDTNPANSGVVTAVFPETGAAPGDMETYTADGVSFAMAYVPGGTTFPTGTDDLGTPATVDDAYWIGETEVTYELWYKVYTWASDPSRGADQHTFTFTGGSEPRAGTDGTPGSETGSQEPVTYVNWRHAMVWCNALTEWYNANNGTNPDLDCVYYTDSGYGTPIRSADDTGSFDGTAGGQDNPYVNAAAKGFRLLASKEWELAARWRDDATNTVSGYTNPYFTKGNSASGATTFFNDDTNGSGEPGKTANDLVAVYGSYWDGSWVATGVTSTAAVKSKGVNGANALGLYDMSGNVWEWCFDLYSGSSRVMRDGSCFSAAYYLQVGHRGDYDPSHGGILIGFRFARTQ